MESPFSQVGPALYARGYSPIPITPGDKRPGLMVGSEWRLFKGWNEFCVQRPSEFQIRLWSKWPNAGVGVATGMGLIGIDIDREEVMAAVMEILPPCEVRKKGRKGITLFYRGNTDRIRSKNYRTPERIGLVDLLAEGKQTVLPPSIHPDTGEPYYWQSDDTLEDVSLDALTELPEDIAEQIGEVLKAFGFDPDRERAATPLVETTDTGPAQTTNFYRKLNEDALANIPAWAPALQLPRGRFLGRVYRAVAPWRGSGSGRPLNKRSPNLSIAPGGIEDFGTGETFTALNVVMRTMNISDAEKDAATQWLGEKLGYDFGIAIDLRTIKKEKLAAPAPTMALAHERVTPLPEGCALMISTPTTIEREPGDLNPDAWIKANPAQTPAIISTSEPVEETFDDGGPDYSAPEMSELESLCYAPGLVGEIMEWVIGCTSSPSRPLALGAALTFVGTLAGRYHSGPTDLRTNLYVVALAPSGYGKDHARKCISRLASESGLDRYIGPESFLSDSALRKTVEHKPALLCLMDEFGGFISKIMDRRAGTHQSGMRQLLTQLYTSANDCYRGAASASENAQPIFNPNLSLYGVSTPHDFWPAMSGRGLGDGFLPRWLVLNVTGKPQRDVAHTQPYDPSSRLIEWCRAIVSLSRTGNLADATAGRVKARMAEFGDHGLEAYRQWRDYFQVRHDESSLELQPIWNRSMEIALRISHIVAVGCDPQNVRVTGDLMDWACKLSLHSTLSMIIEVRDRLASTEKQAEYLKVRRLIKDAGRDGLSVTALKRAINGEFDLIRLDNITKQLTETKQIESRLTAGPKGGRPGLRYFAR